MEMHAGNYSFFTTEREGKVTLVFLEESWRPLYAGLNRLYRDDIFAGRNQDSLREDGLR